MSSMPKCFSNQQSIDSLESTIAHVRSEDEPSEDFLGKLEENLERERRVLARRERKWAEDPARVVYESWVCAAICEQEVGLFGALPEHHEKLTADDDYREWERNNPYWWETLEARLREETVDQEEVQA